MSNADQQGKNPLRIVIVDDDPFVRTSLNTILSAQPDIEICGEAANGIKAYEAYDRLLPDILLMDIQMPECTGLEAAKRIQATHPQARIVFLTTFADDEYIVQALRMGSRGYLIKQEVAQIAPALRAVIAGQVVLGDEVMGKVDILSNDSSQASSSEGSKQDHASERGLSNREFEIMELVAQGLDNKEISNQVYISEGTVRNQVSIILQKLGLKNRTQIAVYYYQEL